MDRLTAMLSNLLAPEALVQAEEKYQRQFQNSPGSNLQVLPPDPAAEARLDSISSTLDDGLDQKSILAAMLQFAKPKFPPLEMLPCANVKVQNYKACENHGTMACGSCKLVSYCSKGCQKAHWPIHKVDCRNKMRSPDWQPGYIAEMRSPTFVSAGSSKDEFNLRQQDPFSKGAALWGNMPAIDIVNFAANENQPETDLKLAFVASGDLRNVMLTVNSLPTDYSGNLNIIIDDLMAPLSWRNIIILIILGTLPDKTMAADIALHFWYSAFLPMEYRMQIMSAISSYLEQIRDGRPVPLGPSSTLLSGILPQWLAHIMSPSMTVDEAQEEYTRVRNAQSRLDFRDRMYSGLRPSHRVAFQEYRRFGILLPFGAVNAHFNVPNTSLFMPNGTWLQTDYADPLLGYDTQTVVDAGRSHGAQPEDIYGCLYFYLTEQLRLFSSRIQSFRITFRIFDLEATVLSQAIRKNDLVAFGIPSSIKFDRIDVSNIIDNNYVGLDAVLSSWGPLLADNKYATLVGYFMNWAPLCQPDGLATNSSDVTKQRLLRQVIERNKHLLPTQGSLLSLSAVPGLLSSSINLTGQMQMFYDNSKSFSRYLKEMGLDDILRRYKLSRRKHHILAPYRIGVPVSGSEDALPQYLTNDSYYYNTRLKSHTWSERFIEFGRRQ